MNENDAGLSVIVPCFNEEAGIEATLIDLKKYLKGVGLYEIIVVNDGSTDKTPDILSRIANEDKNLRIVVNTRNRGYGAALKLGIQRSKFGIILITDADGTYPADTIPALMLTMLNSNADMVVGARIGDTVNMSRLRAIPKFFLKHYAQWIVNHDIPDLNSGLRVFRKSVAQRFMGILPDGFSFTTTITLSLLADFYNVEFYPIDYRERVGNSKIRPIRDTLKFFNLIFRAGVYFAPYRVFGPIGLFFVIATGISATYDYSVLQDLSGKTQVFLLLGLNTLFFATVAEMIDRRASN